MDISTRRILILAFPAVLSMVSFNIMQFADRAFLSRYNPQHFAAVMPSGMISFTVLSFFIGVAGFVGALASQYTGAERRGAPAKSTWQGLYFSVMAGVLILATAYPVSRVFGALGHESSLANLEAIFYRWMCLSGFFNLCATALSGYFTGLGDTRTPMLTSLLAHGVNLLLDGLLIFGLGPFPEWGLVGAAVATTTANGVQALLLLVIFLNRRHRRDHDTWIARGWDGDLFKRLMRFGAPAGLQFFLDMSGWGLMTLFLGRAGEKVLMAVNISITFESLAFMPAVGLATAASILAGQARGAGKTNAIAVIVRRTISLTLLYELFIMILFLIFPQLLVSFFLSGSDPLVYDRVRELAVPILRITGIWIGIDGVRILLASVLKTMGDTTFLMWAYGVGAAVIAAATAMWVYLSVNPLLPVWLTILTWAFLMFAVMALRFRSGVWKKIDLIGAGQVPTV